MTPIQLAERLQIEWDRPGQYNACKLCDHARGEGHLCASPDVIARDARPMHTSKARAGACGIEARFLTFPGLEPAGERVRDVYSTLQAMSDRQECEP